MIFSVRALIRGLVAPDHQISCSTGLWQAGLAELNRRGAGQRESGAFLLGQRNGERREIRRFVYYDDLDPHCLDVGIVVFDGAGYGPLWALCRGTGLAVVGDVNTNPDEARQSITDRKNPMVAVPGHIAIIVPELARRPVRTHELGVYEYMGEHRWREYCGMKAGRFFYIGHWG